MHRRSNAKGFRRRDTSVLPWPRRCSALAVGAVLLALPLLDVLLAGAPRRARGASAYAAGAVLLLPLQVTAWRLLHGPGFLELVRNANLVGGEPQILALLFSARHGLFTWTPVFLLAVAGWLLGLRRDARLFGLALAGFVLAVLANASMQDWWWSDAFGQRRLLGLIPLFALGLAEGIAFLAVRPLLTLSASMAALALWNVADPDCLSWPDCVFFRDAAAGPPR